MPVATSSFAPLMVCPFPLGPFSPHVQCVSACPPPSHSFVPLYFSVNASPMRATLSGSLSLQAAGSGNLETMGLKFWLFLFQSLLSFHCRTFHHFCSSSICLLRDSQILSLTLLFCFCMCSVAPVFRQKITPLEINFGSNARFECETEDAPSVTFKWFKSGIEIKQSEKCRIVSRHTSSSLELLRPLQADSGEYTCKASNQHGADSCSASLTVTGKSLWHERCFPCERERILGLLPGVGLGLELGRLTASHPLRFKHPAEI